VQRRSGAPGSVGLPKQEKDAGLADDLQGEYWLVTTPDGTQYRFGYGSETTEAGTLPTNSNWTVPVFANSSGEPCRNKSTDNRNRFCQRTWRWMLDEIKDPTGNLVHYVYAPQMNYYGRAGYPGQAYTEPYVAGGYLSAISYTKRTGAEEPPARVDFFYQNRCTDLSSACDTTYPPTDAPTGKYPDTPTDLICPDTYCEKYAPGFFVTKRLQKIETKVLKTDGSGWTLVDRIELTHEFPAAANGPTKLWLAGITRTGFTPTGTATLLPSVTFTKQAKANRVDVNTAAEVDPGVVEVQWRSSASVVP
jgi:hypothetical protein